VQVGAALPGRFVFFDGATPTDVVISIAEREPAPLAGCAPEVPLRLERIVKKALARELALVYGHVGRLDEALQELEKAIATNPSNALARFRVGEMFLFQGKHEQALTALRGVPAEVNPALVGHQIVWALFNLGRKEEASATLKQFLRDYPEDNRGLLTSLEAILAASDGQERMAEGKIKLAVERGKGFGHFHHTAYYIACAYALMDKREQAIKWLEVAAEGGFPCYPLFERDTNLDNLRQDARFVTFLAKLRQQWEYYKTILCLVPEPQNGLA
jgi:tetratricopeptide (TPR) repeat protein